MRRWDQIIIVVVVSVVRDSPTVDRRGATEVLRLVRSDRCVIHAAAVIIVIECQVQSDWSQQVDASRGCARTAVVVVLVGGELKM